MDVEAWQKQLRTFADERDWHQFHTPKNLAMALSVEASELLEIFQWLASEESMRIMDSSEAEHVQQEVADVLICLLRLADILKIDLEAAVSSKIDVNATKHPPLDK